MINTTSKMAAEFVVSAIKIQGPGTIGPTMFGGKTLPPPLSTPKPGSSVHFGGDAGLTKDFSL